MNKLIAALSVTALCLAGLIILALVTRTDVRSEPGDPFADDVITEAEFEAIKKAELDRPPKVWASVATDTSDLADDWWKWFLEEGWIVPETEQAVSKWIDSEEPTLDKIVTNEPTGAQYRVIGERTTAGATCSIKFVGNVGWK